jgi:hypothetical protein
VKEIVFFLEEPSAEAMLEGILPKLLPSGFIWRAIVFEGKQDLEKRIGKRMRSYLNPEARFVVLRDQDAADCYILKNRLLEKCRQASKNDTIVRIACHELESFYLADLAAIEKGFAIKGLTKLQDKEKYRSPDIHPKPSQILSSLVPAYQKISGSRSIGPHLNLDNSRSLSFKNLIAGIKKTISENLEIP